MKIVVLGGGSSPEREVSLRSAAAVTQALQAAGFETIEIDPAQEGWLNSIQPGWLVFPILHGAGGEDGSLQLQLEAKGIPYLGSDSSSSKLCFDKWQARLALAANRLPTAKGAQVTEDTYYREPLAKQPHVLKVRRGGSSIGTYIVHDPDNVEDQKVREVFRLDKQAIVEELVEGVEITVPILDIKALPVIEIQPPETGEFDFENKYNGKTKELCPPISVDDETQHQAQKLAEQAHKSLGCRHLSRVDIIVRPNGNMVLLEVNTIPGMTSQSLYPLAAKTAGLDFPKLMTSFVELIKRDYGL